MAPVGVLAYVGGEAARGRDPAHHEHASAYLTKPLYLQEFAQRTRTFLDFWPGNVAILPPATLAK